GRVPAGGGAAGVGPAADARVTRAGTGERARRRDRRGTGAVAAGPAAVAGRAARRLHRVVCVAGNSWPLVLDGARTGGSGLKATTPAPPAGWRSPPPAAGRRPARTPVAAAVRRH